METVQNIIRKQTVDFTYSGKTKGMALQQEVQDWCTLSLIPEIEQELNLFAPKNRYITINRLEIDVATSSADWKQKIRDELIFSLKRKLSEQYTPATGEAETADDSVLQKLDDLMLFYFEKGYLPWWSSALIADDFDAQLQRWLIEEKRDARAAYIVRQLQQIFSVTVITRLMHAMPGKIFFQFCEHVFTKQKIQLKQAEEFLNGIIHEIIPAAKQNKLLVTLKEFMLASLTREENMQESLPQLAYAILQHQNLDAVWKQTFSKQTIVDANPIKMAWYQLLEQEQRVVSTTETKGLPKQKAKTGKLQYNKLIDIIREKTPAGNKKLISSEDGQEGIYIENAGAVIFAAFLAALFERIKISKGQTLVKPKLAALLIQYIVSGKANAAEHELVLPKILCGIPLEQALDTNIKIPQAHLKQADALLLAVIEHWLAIKNTSKNGLRESFLQRSGKLSFVNNEWQLQVEQKAFDILLQQLPWSISMIKLPWMTNLLRTEWV